jgi:peptide/nickel transport system substrate-binding protein
VFRILTDPASQISALQTGEINMAQNLETVQIASLTASGTYKRDVVTSPGMPYGFMINTQNAPTDEVRVRQAIEYAIDRPTIMQTLYQGLYSPAYGLLTPAMFGYNPRQYFGYDPSKAMSILESAGWTGSGTRKRGGKTLEVTWLMPVGFGFQDVAQLLATQLQAVGISSLIHQEASPGVFTDMAKGVMNLAGFFLFAADPYVLLDVFSCAGVGTTSNTARYCNPAVQKQINLANATADTATRQSIYQSVQNMIMSSACFLPIYNVAGTFVYSRSLSGVQYAALALPLFTGVTA